MRGESLSMGVKKVPSEVYSNVWEKEHNFSTDNTKKETVTTHLGWRAIGSFLFCFNTVLHLCQSLACILTVGFGIVSLTCVNCLHCHLVGRTGIMVSVFHSIQLPVSVKYD